MVLITRSSVVFHFDT